MPTLVIGDKSRYVNMSTELIEDENGTFVRVQFTEKAFLDLHPDDAQVLALRLMGVTKPIRKVPDPRQLKMFGGGR